MNPIDFAAVILSANLSDIRKMRKCYRAMWNMGIPNPAQHIVPAYLRDIEERAAQEMRDIEYRMLRAAK